MNISHLQEDTRRSIQIVENDKFTLELDTYKTILSKWSNENVLLTSIRDELMNKIIFLDEENFELASTYIYTYIGEKDNSQQEKMELIEKFQEMNKGNSTPKSKLKTPNINLCIAEPTQINRTSTLDEEEQIQIEKYRVEYIYIYI